jgi:hypothetical protein
MSHLDSDPSALVTNAMNGPLRKSCAQTANQNAAGNATFEQGDQWGWASVEILGSPETGGRPRELLAEGYASVIQRPCPFATPRGRVHIGAPIALSNQQLGPFAKDRQTEG